MPSIISAKPRGSMEAYRGVTLADGIGNVQLVQHVGGDLDVVNAAKVSFDKHSSEMGKGERALIRFLMREQHGSPFEHNSFTFKVKAPIFVVREWQRHRIGVSYNEVSGRYVEMKPEFYIPQMARMQKGKPGQYYFVQGTKFQTWWLRFHSKMAVKAEYRRYKRLLKMGIAKEQARIVLPNSLYTEFYFTCNARSLMNFIELRSQQTAMWEIRKYAEAMLFLWGKHMPTTAMTFQENGRKAP